MRALLLASVMAFGLAFVAPLAMAQDHGVFGNTENSATPRAALTFDGLTPFVAADTGWVTSAGRHIAGNPNYFTGTSTGATTGTDFNSFFSFALGALKPVSPYSSAILTLQTGNSIGTAPYLISFFDVSASLLDLDANRSSGDATGQAIYADLGSGVSYGSYSINAPTTQGQTVAIPLNQTFINAVNNGLLTTFSIGGTLTPSVVTAVPEPTSAALFSLGVVGVAMFRRRRAA